ncbi:MAG: LysE family transporter [Candidatus Cryptobacteroides sp.]
MPLEQLPALLLAILAVGYTPGPANIYAMSCSLRYGWRASMRMWLGLLCGFLTAALLAAAAAHLAGMAFREYVPYLRYLAAAYIIYLAWKTYRAGVSSEGDAEPTFSSGFIVQLTNAKIILFDLSCYSAFVLPYSQRFLDLLPVTAILILAGPGANLVWLLVGGIIKPLVRKYSRPVSVTMALALVVCALMMILLN